MTQNLFVPGALALAFALALAQPAWAQAKHLSAQINPDWDKTFPKAAKSSIAKSVSKTVMALSWRRIYTCPVTMARNAMEPSSWMALSVQ